MQFMIGLLNAHVGVYITVCYAALACALCLGARAVRQAWLASLATQGGTSSPVTHTGPRDRGLLFLLALAVAVVLFRLPSILAERMLNPDECAQLVGGWSFLHDPVPWRGSDNGSSGPFNMYILTAAFALGLPFKLMTARIVMVMLTLTLIGCTYWTLRRLGSDLAAVPGAVCIGLFVCLARDANHLHYNSEALPIALLAAALVCFLASRSIAASASRTLFPLYFTGLLLGAIPYAKLQAAPLGLFWALIFAIELWRDRRDKPGRWLGFLAFGLGGISVPLLITSALFATGTWPDFITSYLGFGSSYGLDSSQRWITACYAFSGTDMPWFLLYALLIVLVPFAFLDRTSKSLTNRFRPLLFAFLGYLVMAFYVVQAPNMGAEHYSAFVLHPVGLLVGLCSGEIALQLAARAAAGRSRPPKLAAAWISIVTLALVVAHIFSCRIEMRLEDDLVPTFAWGPNTFWVPLLPVLPRNVYPVADFIAEHAHPGDRMSVWGWAPKYYVYAGVPNATRDTTTILAMAPTVYTARTPDSLREYSRRRYLAEMQRVQPMFFVDAVSSSEFICKDRQTLGHETWPELARFINEKYEMVYELENAPGDGTRVYRLKSP